MSLATLHQQARSAIAPNLPTVIDPLLRMPGVEAATGLRRSRIYELIKSGHFPAPVKIGTRATGWRTSQVARWIEERSSQPVEA